MTFRNISPYRIRCSGVILANLIRMDFPLPKADPVRGPGKVLVFWLFLPE
jgi:hypothetical protein